MPTRIDLFFFFLRIPETQEAKEKGTGGETKRKEEEKEERATKLRRQRARGSHIQEQVRIKVRCAEIKEEGTFRQEQKRDNIGNLYIHRGHTSDTACSFFVFLSIDPSPITEVRSDTQRMKSWFLEALHYVLPFHRLCFSYSHPTIIFNHFNTHHHSHVRNNTTKKRRPWGDLPVSIAR